MKLTWITDIHLNFINLYSRQKFYQSIIDSNADAVLISGDIAETHTVTDILLEITHHTGKSIHFVLGNHDYYHGSFDGVRKNISYLCECYSQLNWLPQSLGIKLTSNIVLVGEDCLVDGRYVDYANSQVVLNDSLMISELYEGSILGQYQLLDAMQKIADFDAKRLKHNLEFSINEYNPKKIIVLIHVPPFKESCMHKGNMCNDDYLPFFSSKVTGDMLIGIAKQNSEIEFLVLCGHTHSESYYKPLNNLTVKTDGSEYMYPEIQEFIEI